MVMRASPRIGERLKGLASAVKGALKGAIAKGVAAFKSVGRTGMARSSGRKLSSVRGPLQGVTGVEEVLANLRDLRYTKAPAGYVKGLKKALTILKNASIKVVPVGDGKRRPAGTLRDSWYSEVEGEGFDAVGKFGYSDPIAIYVHERTELKHKRGKMAKFIETPLRQNLAQMKQVIRDSMKTEMEAMAVREEKAALKAAAKATAAKAKAKAKAKTAAAKAKKTSKDAAKAKARKARDVDKVKASKAKKRPKKGS